MSPRKWPPFLRFFSSPPRSSSTSARLMAAWPQMLGARLSPSSSNSWVQGIVSARLRMRWAVSKSSPLPPPPSEPLICCTLVATMSVRNTPDTAAALLPGTALKRPTQRQRSPGFSVSTRSSSSTMSTLRGSCPGGAHSGISCSVMLWLSRYVDSPYSVVSRLPASSLVGYTLPVGCPVRAVTSRYSTDLNCLRG